MNMKRLLTSWHIWAVLLVAGTFLFFQRSFDASILFPLALVLVCPIMMMFMMKDHKH